MSLLTTCVHIITASLNYDRLSGTTWPRQTDMLHPENFTVFYKNYISMYYRWTTSTTCSYCVCKFFLIRLKETPLRLSTGERPSSNKIICCFGQLYQLYVEDSCDLHFSVTEVASFEYITSTIYLWPYKMAYVFCVVVGAKSYRSFYCIFHVCGPWCAI